MGWARHWFAEHTSELEIALEAETLADLFAEGARALAEVMGGEPRPPTGSAETVSVQARDREALLVAWLNELLYLGERDKKLYGEAEVERLAGGELSARVRGWEAPSLRTQVKAATLHGLRIAEGPRGLSVHVILDV